MPSKAYQVLYGNLGSKFGKLGGRPSNKDKPYGLAPSKYKEIVAFLLSKQSNPIYPARMRGGSSRSESKKEKRKYSQNKVILSSVSWVIPNMLCYRKDKIRVFFCNVKYPNY